MDKTVLAELKRLDAEATPGPWRVEQVKGYCIDNIVTDHPDFQREGTYKNHVGSTELATGQDKQRFFVDSKLIVAMRNALPELLLLAQKDRITCPTLQPPLGMVLVPREPSEAMRTAGVRSLMNDRHPTWSGKAERCYLAMLAAAAEQTAQEER